MNIEATVKSIRSIFLAINNKNDVDVIITYKGTSFGVTKPWSVRVDAREASHETQEGALNALLKSLKEELINRVKSTEGETARLKAALNSLEN